MPLLTSRDAVADEVAQSVVLEDAVDHRLGGRQAANRLRDPLKTIREVGAASAADLHALALLAGEDAGAVIRRCGSSGHPLPATSLGKPGGSHALLKIVRGHARHQVNPMAKVEEHLADRRHLIRAFHIEDL